MRGMPALKRSGSRWRFAGRTPATPHGLLQSGGSGARDQGTDTRGWREVDERLTRCSWRLARGFERLVVGRLWERCGTVVGRLWEGVECRDDPCLHGAVDDWTIGRAGARMTKRHGETRQN